MDRRQFVIRALAAQGVLTLGNRSLADGQVPNDAASRSSTVTDGADPDLQTSAKPNFPTWSPLLSAEPKGRTFADNPYRLTGYDGATSIVLSANQSLWTFGDTVEGPFESIRTLRLEHLLSNTACLVDRPTTPGPWVPHEYLTDADGQRARQIIEFEPGEDPAKIRLWPVHGIRVDDYVWVYYHLIQLDPQVDVFLGFQLLGMGVARARVGEWKFTRLRAANGTHAFWTGSQPGYGVWVNRHSDGTIYLWGSAMTGMFLARCRPDRLDQPNAYEYLTACPTSDHPTTPIVWGREFAASGVLFANVPNEMSAHFNPHLGQYVAIHMWNRENCIVARTAPRLEGPWSEPQVVYRPPREADDQFFYAAKEHPELQGDGGRTMRITYVDSLHYYPRTVEVTLR